MEGREECRGEVPSLNCILCHSDQTEYMDVVDRSGCPLVFTDGSAAEGDAGSRLGTMSEVVGDSMGKWCLFLPLRAASSKPKCPPGASAGVSI